MQNNKDTAKANSIKNIIIIDADYVDSVTFDLTVNFERIIGRRIPKADLARWVEYVALDGGVREGRGDTQVIFVHNKKSKKLDNFMPSQYKEKINNQAFKSSLGEFTLTAHKVEEIISKDNFMLDIIKATLTLKEIERIMIIPDTQNSEIYNDIRILLQHVDDDKRITLFAMQPMSGGNFRNEILGYSLMQALGIKSNEIK